MERQIHFELVGEANRLNSEINELMYLLEKKLDEKKKVSHLIEQQREARFGVAR